MYLQEEYVCVSYEHTKITSKSSLGKYLNHHTNLLGCANKDGDNATMGWSNLLINQGSLNLVHNECFRGADMKAQVF